MKLWIARDKNGRLNLFDGKPIKSGDSFIEETGLDNIMPLPISIFPEVIYENSPQQVELISSKEYNRLKDIQDNWLWARCL